MKLMLLLLLLLRAKLNVKVSAKKRIDWTSKWIYDERGNCLPHAIVFCAPKAEVPDEVEESKRDIDPIESFVKEDIIYTFYNPYDGSVQVFNQKDVERDEPVSFDRELPMKILIHGAKLSQTPNNKLKDAYLDYKKYHVITVNWGRIKNKVLHPLPAGGAFLIGRCIAAMLEALYMDDQMQNVHIIGHGQAAHSAGYAGRLLHKKGYDVHRITGLDAANPYIIGGLNYQDAMFVDVIHTNAEQLGTYGIIGHADFYPNGGQGHQPSCKGDYPPREICNTLMAYEYFEETVKNGYRFLASRCDSPEELQMRDCEGEHVYMGEDVDRNARGKYYLKFGDIF